MDHQVRLDGGKFESYSRWVIQITNESGLQASAQVNLGFDPSSESLTLHSVVIHRDGKALDRLDFGAIKVAEREPDLERQVSDGRKSAVLFVEDLRVNDVIDYDFTLRGADPTLGGRDDPAILRWAEQAKAESPAPVALHVTENRRYDGWVAFGRGLIGALAWCAYVARSARVRETFVRGAPRPANAPISAETAPSVSLTPQRAKDPYLLALSAPATDPRAVESGGEGPEGHA